LTFLPQNSPISVIGCQPLPAAGNQLKVALSNLFHPAITLLQRIDSGELSE
jgi:hypothetical protein